MRILPARIRPPENPILRRHSPAAVGGEEGYRKFRACLRWDFGFTCPFCLLHESDFGGWAGVEGLGIMTVEHLVPQSADPDLRNVYSNCVYACRLCNTARWTKPNQCAEGRLLDPTQDAWAAHFAAVEGTLPARDGDRDACYTHVAYDLDDARKVDRRLHREEVISTRRTLLEEVTRRLDRLLKLLEDNATGGWSVLALELAKDLQADLNAAARDLTRFAATPRDAPDACECGNVEARSLPPHVAEGTWEMADLLPSAPPGSAK